MNHPVIIIIESVAIVLLSVALAVFIVLFIRRDRALRKYLFRGRKTTGGNNSETEARLIAALKATMENDRLFTDSSVTLEKTAKQLGTNRSTLSKAINTGLGVNFSTFLNGYRIKEAIRLLNDSNSQSYKIESIGNMCGFNSRQVFHRVFKKETGMNIRQYIKKINSARAAVQ